MGDLWERFWFSVPYWPIWPRKVAALWFWGSIVWRRFYDCRLDARTAWDVTRALYGDRTP